MENVFVKMADFGSGSVETCISSLFIMKHNRLEDLDCTVYDDANNAINDAKCLTIEKKTYFGSCDKLEVTTTDCVLNGCPDLHGTSDCRTRIASFDATVLEDADNYKKKRCVDRYDSSESSDSGVLTGSTCSESSSNSGTSDITDPCSPYSVASFHLGDDSGLSSTSSTSSSKSTEFSNGELLLNSKMLPENSTSEEENDVSCWAWDKNIEWNDRYELTQDDIDVEVKRADFFEVIGRKESRCSTPGQLKAATALDDLVENGIGNRFDANELRIRLTKNSLDSLGTAENYAASGHPSRATETKDFLYDKVFHSKRVGGAATRMDNEKYPFVASKTTATASSTTTATSRFFVDSSYPLDFFNILPSVFKNQILHSTDCGWVSSEAEEEDDEDDAGCCDNDSLVDAATLSADVHLCCQSDMKTLDDNVSSTITINNNSKYNSNNNNNNNYINGECVKRTSYSNSSDDSSHIGHYQHHYYHNAYPLHLDDRMEHPKPIDDDEDDEDDTSEHSDHCTSNKTDLISFSERATRSFEANETAAQARKQSTQAATDSVSVDKENIRFPNDKKLSFLAERICRWSDCVDHISSSTKLIEHLQTKHVNPQTFSETFICLWSGCKVFGRPSCSRTWLERHVLSHGGNKPYKCIVDNCGQRFSSQTILERHINQHFKTPKEYTDGVADTTPKLIRRNGQKLRYRRQPYSVRSRADVFDAGIMSQLQFLLVQMARRSKKVSLNVLDSNNFLHVAFQPKVIGSRRETNGDVKYLVRWYPYNALEDEWLPKSEIESTKNVPIWKLPASVQQLFWDSVFPKRSSIGRQPRKYRADRGDAR